MSAKTYPDCYLHVRESRSGEEWIVPIGPRTHLNLKELVRRWCKRTFDCQLQLDGEIMPKLEGDYYARIMTDGRPPDSVVCWTGGGFYLKGVE